MTGTDIIMNGIRVYAFVSSSSSSSLFYCLVKSGTAFRLSFWIVCRAVIDT